MFFKKKKKILETHTCAAYTYIFFFFWKKFRNSSSFPVGGVSWHLSGVKKPILTQPPWLCFAINPMQVFQILNDKLEWALGFLSISYTSLIYSLG